MATIAISLTARMALPLVGLLLRMSLAARPYFGEPTPAPCNLKGEDHLLWNIPVHWCLGLPMPIPACTVTAQVNTTPERVEHLLFAQPWRRKPEPLVTLVPGVATSLPVVIRSRIGERVRLSTDPGIYPVYAPRDVGRVTGLHALWGMGDESMQLDLSPGRDHVVSLELMAGKHRIAREDYRVHVPTPGAPHGAFTMHRITG